MSTSGNMYDWLDYIYNPVRGCTHGCSYCYVKKFKRIKIDKPQLCKGSNFSKYLGEGKQIGICLTGDLLCEGVPNEWIKAVLASLELTTRINSIYGRRPNNYYIQSKNIGRITDLLRFEYVDSRRFALDFGSIIFGTTLESDVVPKKYYADCPSIDDRCSAMQLLSRYADTFITVEPILKCDIHSLLSRIRLINPKFVNIGADSKKCGLPEPDKDQVISLIRGLIDDNIPMIRLKPNLCRIIGDGIFDCAGGREVVIGSYIDTNDTSLTMQLGAMSMTYNCVISGNKAKDILGG